MTTHGDGLRGVVVGESEISDVQPEGNLYYRGYNIHELADRATFDRAVAADLKPHKIADTLAFMVETRLAVRPTRFALETPALQRFKQARSSGVLS